MKALFLKIFAWVSGISITSLLANPLISQILIVVGSFKIISPILQKAIDACVEATPSDWDNKIWLKVKKFLNENKIIKNVFKLVAWLGSVYVPTKKK